MADALQEWTQSVDVLGDKKKDGPEFDQLKKYLYSDAKQLWEKHREGKITRAEYDQSLQKMKEILERHYSSVNEVYKEYAMQKTVVMNLSLSGLDMLGRMARNTITKAKVEMEQMMDKDLIQGYTRERGNYNISVKDFEKKIQTANVNDLNTRELLEYFKYLRDNHRLTSEVLRQKFPGSKLEDLMMIWKTKLEGYFRGMKGRNSEEIESSLGTQLWNKFISSADETIGKEMGELLEDMMGRKEVSALENMFQHAQKQTKSKKKKGEMVPEDKETRQYSDFIAKAHTAFKKWAETEQQFRTRFEKHLSGRHSSLFDALYELIKEDTGAISKVKIEKFQDIMKSIMTIAADKQKSTEEKIVTDYGLSANFWTLPKSKQDELVKTHPESKALSELIRERNRFANEQWDSGPASTKEGAVVTMAHISRKDNVWAAKQSLVHQAHSQQIRNSLDTRENRAILQKLGKITLEQMQGNTRKISDTIAQMEGLPLRTADQNRLLSQLREYKEAQQIANKDGIMVMSGLSSEQYDRALTDGTIPDVSFSELVSRIDPSKNIKEFSEQFKIEVRRELVAEGKLAPDAEVRAQANSASLRFGESDSTRIAAISVGQTTPVDFISGQKAIVKRTENGYDVEVDGRTESCATIQEVTTCLDVHKTFHSIGLGFMMGSFDHVIDAVNAKYTAALGHSLDTKKGFTSKDMNILLHAVIDTFKLPINIGSTLSTQEMLNAFRSKRFIASEDVFEKQAQDQGFIDPNTGKFLENRFITALL